MSAEETPLGNIEKTPLGNIEEIPLGNIEEIPLGNIEEIPLLYQQPILTSHQFCFLSLSGSDSNRHRLGGRA